MLTLESIVKYKNFKIREQGAIKQSDLKVKVAKNQLYLSILYVVLYILMVAVIGSFGIYFIMCIHKGEKEQPTYFAPLACAILNLVLWVILASATCIFVRMLNQRFGEKEFAGPKCRLFFFLSVFSLSFFVRGSYDLGLVIAGDTQQSDMVQALLLFLVYFLTEWLPIFVIYLTHLYAFIELRNKDKKKQKSEVN